MPRKSNRMQEVYARGNLHQRKNHSLKEVHLFVKKFIIHYELIDTRQMYFNIILCLS